MHNHSRQVPIFTLILLQCMHVMLQVINYFITMSPKICTSPIYTAKIKVMGYRVGGGVSRQLQPPVATAPLLSPSWKQHSIKPVILASIARAERSTTCVDMHLRGLPPRNFSHQKSDLAQKIQHRRLQSRCVAATSSKWIDESFFA